MRWTSCTMARHDSVAMGNALRRKSIEKCSFSRLKPRIFACGARAAGCAGESVEMSHARVNRLCSVFVGTAGVAPSASMVHFDDGDGDTLRVVAASGRLRTAGATSAASFFA